MRIEKQLTDNRFLNLKEVQDPDNNVRGYQFAERLGVDSVAFILYDHNTKEYMFNKEYKPPVNQFILGAFGGSMDKDKTPIEIVIGEVKEEAGFVVTEDNINDLGKVLVSTQMNQFCHLFLVKVDKNDQDEREPENAIEAMAETKWVSWNSEIISRIEDWKPLAIILKAEHKGILSA